MIRMHGRIMEVTMAGGDMIHCRSLITKIQIHYDYILHVAAKWVSPPYNADGWRLDVAADLGHSPEYNHQFWRRIP